MREMLKPFYREQAKCYEIGVDEAGRGPMFGRVYTAAVILPKDLTVFNHALMKDSKKFHSVKKIQEAADYIKTHAIAWQITYADETTIDHINIRNATLRAMHEAIKACMHALEEERNDYHILVDGNDFKPLLVLQQDQFTEIPHTCIEGGDNEYSAIAAASILAKVARDSYVQQLCLVHPLLDIRYDLLRNKGYGTAKHMLGIQTYGISQYHRKSFGLCKNAAVNEV
jgi:ribonuclease HII